jgi:DNA polymerase theta
MAAEAFDRGILKVMIATCSLAAGINLPARRVVLNGARMGRELVGPAMLRQMRGRTGRKGKDEIGETYLCCRKSDLEAVANLVPPVQSCLILDKGGVKRAPLEVVCTRLANSCEAINDYIQYSKSQPQKKSVVARIYRRVHAESTQLRRTCSDLTG